MPSNTTLIAIAGVALLILIIIIVVYYYYSQSSSASSAAALQSVASASNPGATASIISTPGAAPTASVSTYPAGLTEGEVVRCATTGNIYQLVNGTIQWYPSTAVYAKYGNPPFTNIDCNVLASIPAGPNLS